MFLRKMLSPRSVLRAELPSGHGHWHLARSKTLSVGLSNAHFKSLGLPSLIEARWRNFSNRRIRTRTYGGSGNASLGAIAGHIPGGATTIHGHRVRADGDTSAPLLKATHTHRRKFLLDNPVALGAVVTFFATEASGGPAKLQPTALASR
jgi:hypothetical protein